MNSAGKNILKAAEVSDLVINSLPGVFYVQAQSGRYLRWNKNFEEVSGYSSEEIATLSPLDFFETVDHPRIAAVIRKVFEQGEGEIEITTITKCGDKIPYFFNGKAVIYEGEPCLLGMGIDISERINAQKEVKSSVSHLQALFDNVGGAVFLLDSQKRLVIFNNELARTYNILAGTTIGPVPGELAYSFLPPDEMAARHAVLDRALSGKKEVIEVSYDRNGERYYFRSGFNPVVIDGKVTGISCYTIDITSSKNAALKIQKTQERLSYHINNSPLAVIEYDKDLKITFWSKRAVEMFGWSEEEALGMKATSFLVHEDDINKIEDSLLLYGSQERAPVANRNYAKDGRILHCRWHQSFLTDEHGNIETVMAMIRDITDLWKAELQREEIANDLTKRNAELEQFTYIVSHNLRSPVASLIGLSEVLTDYDIPEQDKREVIAGIASSAQRLDNVIRDLNEILRLKTDLNDKKELVSFPALVTEIEQSLNEYLNRDQFIIETDFSRAHQHYTLKNYLSSIFSNLITNSIKYRKPGEIPVIRIKSEALEHKIVLTFKDNGLGIDLNKTGEDIFGLYKRFHFHVEGKGLGLFMVKVQVETLGGRINVSSEVDKGTEFRIEFDT